MKSRTQVRMRIPKHGVLCPIVRKADIEKADGHTCGRSRERGHGHTWQNWNDEKISKIFV